MSGGYEVGRVGWQMRQVPSGARVHFASYELWMTMGSIGRFHAFCVYAVAAAAHMEHAAVENIV